MRRNFSVIRYMLLQVEEAGRSIDFSSEWNGGSAYQVSNHVDMIVESGLAKGSCGRLDALTDKGRDWLDLVRDDEVWNTVNVRIASTVASVPKDLLDELVRAEIEARLRLSADLGDGYGGDSGYTDGTPRPPM